MYAITEGLNTWESEVMQHRAHQNLSHTMSYFCCGDTACVTAEVQRYRYCNSWGPEMGEWLQSVVVPKIKDSQAQLLDPYV